MIQGGEASGYTIVETMIFLAVTAILFASAILIVSGRQATVQFSQATRDAQSRVQDVINQVSTGFFPSGANVTCTAALHSLTAPVIATSATPTQGTSDSCVFLGKVIKFGDGSAADGFNVYSVAARRLDGDLTLPKEVTELKTALPTAIAPKNALDSTPDITARSSLQYGLRVVRVTVPSSSNTYVANDYGAIAFFGSFPEAAVHDADNLVSGAQHVSFGGVPLTDLTMSSYSMVARINAMTSNTLSASYAHMTPDSSLDHGIVICLQDQGSRKAWLTIGGSVGSTTVRLDNGSSPLCP